MIVAIDYFIRIAYDGTEYGGWQRQANHSHTIQQTIEDLLSDVLSCNVSIAGCGRTDSGVHASQFYFYLNSPRELPANFIFIANKMAPADIAFLEVIPMPQQAHACIDAESRSYDYFFHDFADVWLARTSSLFDLTDFQPQLIAKAIPHLLQHNDFREFCLTPDRHNSTTVRFTSVTFFKNRLGNRYRIRFVANRFLRGMIRVLMKDLLSIGTGELSHHKFTEMLAKNPRGQPVRLAPPEGLFLTGVSYPYIEREPDLPICGREDWEVVS